MVNWAEYAGDRSALWEILIISYLGHGYSRPVL